MTECGRSSRKVCLPSLSRLYVTALRSQEYSRLQMLTRGCEVGSENIGDLERGASSALKHRAQIVTSTLTASNSRRRRSFFSVASSRLFARRRFAVASLALDDSVPRRRRANSGASHRHVFAFVSRPLARIMYLAERGSPLFQRGRDVSVRYPPLRGSYVLTAKLAVG